MERLWRGPCLAVAALGMHAQGTCGGCKPCTPSARPQACRRPSAERFMLRTVCAAAQRAGRLSVTLSAAAPRFLRPLPPPSPPPPPSPHPRGPLLPPCPPHSPRSLPSCSTSTSGLPPPTHPSLLFFAALPPPPATHAHIAHVFSLPPSHTPVPAFLHGSAPPHPPTHAHIAPVPPSSPPSLQHVHFGMSGAFRTMSLPGPQPTETTRLELVNK